MFDLEHTGVVSQYELMKKYEADEALQRKTFDYIDSKGLDWFSTPSHQPDVDLLGKLEVGAETFTFSALQTSFLESDRPHHFEHIAKFILENPDQFKTGVLEIPDEKKRPDIRLTADTEEDLQRVCFILERAQKEFVTTPEAIRLCTQFA